MKDKIKNFLKSPLVGVIISKTILIAGIVILVIVIFITGEVVGFKRSQFSYGFGQNYERIFGEREEMMGGMGPFGHMPLPNIHGALGKIVKVDLPSVVIVGSDGVEKIITVDADSLIKRFRDTATTSDLKVGDVITVLGNPNENGTIDARLIRVMPLLATTTATSSLSNATKK
jgi:hypothetical protein